MSTASSSLHTSSMATATPQFWERLWRSAGVQSLVLFAIAYFLYGNQPHVGASAESLVQFYQGGRTRILIATILSGLATLNLMWFIAAIRSTLADAGQDGWGAAATASSATFSAILLALITLSSGLAYSIGSASSPAGFSGLNDFGWAGIVLSSFPRAMMIMSAAFGLWRAGIISSGLFTVGIGAVVLVLLGGTTWISGGIWAPDGIYSRVVSPLICAMWLLIVSGVLLTRNSNARAYW
jgi:hypothetical protein